MSGTGRDENQNHPDCACHPKSARWILRKVPRNGWIIYLALLCTWFPVPKGLSTSKSFSRLPKECTGIVSYMEPRFHLPPPAAVPNVAHKAPPESQGIADNSRGWDRRGKLWKLQHTHSQSPIWAEDSCFCKWYIRMPLMDTNSRLGIDYREL